MLDEGGRRTTQKIDRQKIDRPRCGAATPRPGSGTSQPTRGTDPATRWQPNRIARFFVRRVFDHDPYAEEFTMHVEAHRPREDLSDHRPRRVRSAARRSTACPSRSNPARSSDCSGRTAPASPPPSRCSPRSPDPTRARRRSPGHDVLRHPDTRTPGDRRGRPAVGQRPAGDRPRQSHCCRAGSTASAARRSSGGSAELLDRFDSPTRPTVR